LQAALLRGFARKKLAEEQGTYKPLMGDPDNPDDADDADDWCVRVRVRVRVRVCVRVRVRVRVRLSLSLSLSLVFIRLPAPVLPLPTCFTLPHISLVDSFGQTATRDEDEEDWFAEDDDILDEDEEFTPLALD
jgi:hypothetical protein